MEPVIKRDAKVALAISIIAGLAIGVIYGVVGEMIYFDIVVPSMMIIFAVVGVGLYIFSLKQSFERRNRGIKRLDKLIKTLEVES